MVHVGMDVHQRETVCFAVNTSTGETAGPVAVSSEAVGVKRVLGRIAESLGGGQVRAYYEAGPSGYVLYRALAQEGWVDCRVIAPAFVPRIPGERVKTDRRDAKKLAMFGAQGMLREVTVPSVEREAARDVLRLREQVVEEGRRLKLRIGAFLRRWGIKYELGKTRWTKRYRQWLAGLKLDPEDGQFALDELLADLAYAEARLAAREERLKRIAGREEYRKLVEALMAVRGVGWVTAVSVALEVGDLARFASARQFMSYVGLTCSEPSSGDRRRRGRITKMGNGLLRRMFVEAAWRIKKAPGVEAQLRECRGQVSAAVVAIAEKADKRLRDKYWRLVGRDKATQVAAVAVARELAGVLWAVGVQVHLEQV
jgi:transposase